MEPVERRGFLKGLLGIVPSVILGHKVLSAEEAKELSEGHSYKVLDKCAGVIGPIGRDIHGITNVSSSEGDEIILLPVDEDVEAGSLVAVNSDVHLVPWTFSPLVTHYSDGKCMVYEVPESNPRYYVVGRAIESVEKGGACWILTRQAGIWIQAETI